MGHNSDKFAWIWVPTLFFAEGIPYFIVNTISLVMYKDLGMSNGAMALLTSFISLPWMLKPLWGPFVDITRSKRWWIVAMQVLMAVSVALVAVLVPRNVTADISPYVWTLVFFLVTAFASATHDIAADGFYMIALDRKRQSAFVGIRNTFYRLAMIFGQGVLVVLAAVYEKACGDISRGWTLTLLTASGLIAAVSLYHSFFLPRPEEDRMQVGKTFGGVMSEYGHAFATFFGRREVWLAMAFLLLFRLPEAFSVKMLYPFFSDSLAAGGLGLGKTEFGLIYGTEGMIALLVGGVLGGLQISRIGLRKSMLPMALSLALPCGVYLYMAVAQPASLALIGALVIFDQFGYGYGFTAYTMYMIHVSEGPLKTSHYAICTGFMALSMLLPGAVAGYLQQALGYVGFFIMVMGCCLATVSVALLARRTL